MNGGVVVVSSEKQSQDPHLPRHTEESVSRKRTIKYATKKYGGGRGHRYSVNSHQQQPFLRVFRTNVYTLYKQTVQDTTASEPVIQKNAARAEDLFYSSRRNGIRNHGSS